MERDYTFPPCNLCERIFKSIRKSFDNLPPEEAEAKALNEIYKLKKDSVCMDFYTCMPITRSGYEEHPSSEKSGGVLPL